MLKEIAYYDGVWGSPSELKIPLEDRGYLFGEGVYEVIMAYNHISFALEEHLDRLENSLEKLEMKMPLSRFALKTVVEQGIALVEGAEQMVYLQITRGGSKPRKHSYLEVIDESKLMMTVRPHPTSHDFMQQGLTAITYPDLRWQHCDIKSTSLIPNAMAATAAARAGASLAIMVRDGMVTEGAAESTFMAKDGVLYVTPLSELVLPSITRQHLVNHAADWGLELRQEYFSLEQLLAADEVMLVSTTRHPVPVVKVDDQQIGDGQVGPIAWQVYRNYQAMIDAICGEKA
jgi:D-alanine transaminase